MGVWPEEYLGPCKLFGLDIPKPDSFHELVATEEFAKMTSIGLMWFIG
jgi:hypothetical protein